MYVNRCYGLPDNERLFPIVAEAVQHKLKRACVKSGVKQIRVHDLRHSHVAYLINQGVLQRKSLLYLYLANIAMPYVFVVNGEWK